MDNLDFIHRKEANSSSGREAIPIESVVAIQEKLIMHMAPAVIRHQIEAGQTDLLDRLAERFMEKYVIEHNGLDEFCGDPNTDHQVLERLQTGQFTEEDIATISLYLLSLSQNREGLFRNEEEVAEFMQMNLH